MDEENVVPAAEPQETQRDEVEIRQADALSVGEALALAHSVDYPIGKSTLQRWAKHWSETGPKSPVKCILVTNRLGVAYRIDKSDFEAWVMEQQANQKTHETPPDLPRHQETSRDPARPRDTRQDPTRHREASTQEAGEVNQRLSALEQENAELKTENMNLKIDIGVRKGLLDRAWAQLKEISTDASNLLRENGALQYQIRQLAPPSDTDSHAAQEPPQAPTFIEVQAVDNTLGPDHPAV